MITTEAPDFDQIARHLSDQAKATVPLTEGMIYYDIKDALRQVWNARGAADLNAMETAHENYDWSELEDAIKALDR